MTYYGKFKNSIDWKIVLRNENGEKIYYLRDKELTSDYLYDSVSSRKLEIIRVGYKK